MPVCAGVADQDLFPCSPLPGRFELSPRCSDFDRILARWRLEHGHCQMMVGNPPAKWLKGKHYLALGQPKKDDQE